MDAGENTVVKGEKKAEVLNTFIASIPNMETSCLLNSQSPELEGRDAEQNEAPIMQEEMVNDLLHHL